MPDRIPDYLIYGDSSLGMEWYVLELKSPQESLFSKAGTALNSTANSGISKLIEYVDYINTNLSTLQSTLEIPNLRQVKEMLLIGQQVETDTEFIKDGTQEGVEPSPKGY